ncbi:MAG: AarF/ABC1/UbiB kinase family protein [Bacteroidia bacterium]|nr:AarF/ABC1/UbiB kinase family protein [Bacteroidia bacterium]
MEIPGSHSTLKHIDRYRQVISILIKYGFSDLVAHSALKNLVPNNLHLVPTREGQSVFELERYERIRLCCQELGTTFIKFGQILSNRPDLLPEALISEFEKFQDRVPPMSEEVVKEILAEEYDKPLEELFKEFNLTPLASASIAQVHTATLRDGRKAILKIMRKDLAKTIEADLAIMKHLAGIMLERFPETAAFQPLDLLRMFERAVTRELKFTSEMASMIRFRKNFEGNTDIYVPELFRELCTSKILCMEFIDGVKVSQVETLRGMGFDPHELAVKGVGLYFQQVFDHGFFHADPHPGNFFILRDGRVCFIDFGMMGTVIEADKVMLGDLMLSLARRDVKHLMEVLTQFSNDPKVHNKVQLEYDIIDFFEEYASLSIENLDGGDVVKGLNILFFDYKMKIPGNLLLLLKALVMIEGVGLMLDPSYNIIDEMEPYVERLIRRKYKPAKLAENAWEKVKSLTYLTDGLPQDIKGVLNKLEEGKIHIEYEAKGLDPLTNSLNAFSKRIGFAIVFAACLVGSSLVVLSGLPPKWNDIPVIGVGGFVISALFGIRFMMSIFKKDGF